MRNLTTTAIAVAMLSACTVGETSETNGKMANTTVNTFMAGTVTGSGTFEQPTDSTSVMLTLTINNCVAGKSYNSHIHTGPTCTDTTTQGGHWDMTRGEGIPAITCSGTTGTVTYTRAATDPALAWSVDGDATTNVIGHLIVVHDPDDPTMRIACGAIAAAN
jgi:hypothetical protein